MDPQIFYDIKNYLEIELLVIVAGFCRNMQFSIAIGSLSYLLDSVVIDFDNVTTYF